MILLCEHPAAAAGNPSLFEGKIIVDKTYGHLAYGCVMCCGFANPQMLANPEYLAVQGQDYLGVWATDQCQDDQVDVSDNFSGWDTNNHSVAMMSSRQITGMGAGSTNAFASGKLNFGSESSNKCVLRPYTPPNNNNIYQPSLSCSPPSVTRGASTTCTVTVTPSASFTTAWKFTDGNNNQVVGTTNGSTWSGMMVTSGTVSATVTITSAGKQLPAATASITLNSRSNFAFTAVGPTQLLANSITCYDGNQHNLQSPPASGAEEGNTCADLAYSFNFATISDNGPNNGYEYVTSGSDRNGNLPTKIEYIVVSDLLSATTFYNAQCGTYSSSNGSGFIAGSQLKQNVFDHEQGSVLSHWTEYRDAQNNSSNNIGVTLEAALGPPGSSGNSFAKTPADAALNRIAQAVTVEPCGGSVNDDSGQGCKFCGAINFYPYQSCVTNPVPYCQ